MTDPRISSLERRFRFGATIYAAMVVLLFGCSSTRTADNGGAGQGVPERLAFLSKDGNTATAYVVRADGTDLHSLSTNVATGCCFPSGEPVWSPSGQSVALLIGKQERPGLTIVDSAQPSSTLVVTNLFVTSPPSWATAGDRVAFSAIQGDAEDIYVLSMNGNVQNLTGNSITANANPVWSPDGEWIAYNVVSGTRKTINPKYPDRATGKLYIMKSDGTHSQSLWEAKRPANASNEFDWLDECEPAWSPDSRRLAFQLSCNPANTPENVYVLDLHTWNVSKVTASEDDPIQLVGLQDWINNDAILFSSFHDGSGKPAQLFMINADGTNQQEFGSWDGIEWGEADWTRNGRWLVWRDSSSKEILIGDRATNSLKYTSVKGCNPHWSPSGLWIAYTTECIEGQKSDVWVMDRNGKNLKNLTAQLPGEKYFPVWAPK